jgi:hypothetical protein
MGQGPRRDCVSIDLIAQDLWRLSVGEISLKEKSSPVRLLLSREIDAVHC